MTGTSFVSKEQLGFMVDVKTSPRYEPLVGLCGGFDRSIGKGLDVDRVHTCPCRGRVSLLLAESVLKRRRSSCVSPYG